MTKTYTEQYGEREEFETVNLITVNASYSIILRKIKPKKINNKAIEAPKISMKVSKIDAIEEKDNKIERGEDDNENDSEAPKNGTVNSEVINTHTVNGIKKDNPTSLEKWTGTKDWPRKNVHHRIQPAGNKASSNQKDYPLGSPGQMENNDDVDAKERRTYTDEDILPKVSTKDNASADREKETDIRDSDASEIILSDRFHLKQHEDTQGRDLKEISMNIGNQSYNSCNQCDYVTNRKNKVANHLQDHCDGLKRNYKDKTNNGTQIEKDVSFLKPEESSRKTVSREWERTQILKVPRCWKTYQIPRQPKRSLLGQFLKNQMRATYH